MKLILAVLLMAVSAFGQQTVQTNGDQNVWGHKTFYGPFEAYQPTLRDVDGNTVFTTTGSNVSVKATGVNFISGYHNSGTEGSKTVIYDGSQRALIVSNKWVSFRTNDTQYAEINTTSGFTGNGAGLTNSGTATNGNQFVTLGQMENAISGTEVYYFNGASNAVGFSLSGTVLSTNLAVSDFFEDPITNTISGYNIGDYAIAFITDTAFNTIASGLIECDIFCYSAAGGSVSIQPEMYIVNDVTKAEEYEFTPVPTEQDVQTGPEPTKLTFSVAVPDYTSTTNLRVMVKIKIADLTVGPDLSIVSGNGYASHIAFSQPLSAYVRKSGSTMTGQLTVNSPLSAWSVFQNTNATWPPTFASLGATTSNGTWSATSNGTPSARWFGHFDADSNVVYDSHIP